MAGGRQLSSGFVIAYSLAASALLAAAAGLRYRSAVWNLPPEVRLPVLCLAGAVVVAGVIVAVLARRVSGATSWNMLVATLLAFGLTGLAILVLVFDIPFSRPVLVGMCIGGVVLMLGMYVLPRALRIPTVAGFVVLAAAISWLPALFPPNVPEVEVRDVASGLYNTRIVVYNQQIGSAPSTEREGGGGIVAIGDQYLISTWDGRLQLVRRHPDRLDVTPLRGLVPINIETFERADVYDPSYRGWFRVSDLTVQTRADGGVRLLASHHFWMEEARCSVIRLSVADTRQDVLETDPLSWRTLFESTPCLPIKPQWSRFAGHQSGGRILPLDADTILLTLGDQEFDGVNSAVAYIQDPAASYGKILQIDAGSGASQVYSLGHRNPQGLAMKSDGTLWETEHGPRGGDELNQIVRGENYGWPFVTYGTDYGLMMWPTNPSLGRHDGYRAPVYAWMPSVGISNLVEVTSDRFPAWRGDFLVGSLKGRTLFRVRIVDGRVVMSESLPVGNRIRDLVIADNGDIALWFDDGKVGFLEPADKDFLSDALLFSSRCGGCHTIRDGTGHGIGPDLFGVTVRNVATVPGFGYSPALSGLGGRWTDERLNALLTDPQAFLPGMAMGGVSVSDPGERAAIIAFLKDVAR